MISTQYLNNSVTCGLIGLYFNRKQQKSENVALTETHKLRMFVQIKIFHINYDAVFLLSQKHWTKFLSFGQTGRPLHGSNFDLNYRSSQKQYFNNFQPISFELILKTSLL